MKKDQKGDLSPQRYKLHVNGIVQGVGFRPFVHQLAVSLGLRGYVRNNANGVEIDIQGNEDSIHSFIRQIKTNPPPLAQIVDFTLDKITPEVVHGFRILQSSASDSHTTSISPDMAVCADCLKELFNPSDRRFRYPFINCTNCGPRYTIVFDIPYDRPFTSMRNFDMCPDCEREYNDPSDRRFHAQPNACPVCGPRAVLLDKSGNDLRVKDPVRECIKYLQDGSIVAVKGLGGFHLTCDADNEDAVNRLRERKYREEKPLAVMVSDISDIDSFAFYSREEARLLTSPQRPIVLLKKKAERPLAVSISPRNKNYGVMIAYTPLHYLLLDSHIRAAAATSGNISEEPIAISNEEALKRLRNIADYFLVHNRDILVRSDDSVARVINNLPVIIRRSRGYVPAPIILPVEFPQVLGCGGELKNTLCYLRGRTAYLSQHIGDLENITAFQFYQETQEHLANILDISPSIAAYDMHPDYFSTKFAKEQKGVELAAVQHHHAHMVSCMAENGCKEAVIGIILDGTGYGTDGCVWGGEVLIGGYSNFRRIAHLEYLPMPGGEKAIKEPWRMAISYLYRTFGDSINDLPLPVILTKDAHVRNILVKMINRKVNSPLTSSCGRLFDGVSAILGIQMENRFEGQAAMELEQCISKNPEPASYSVSIKWKRTPISIPYQPIISSVVADFLNKESISSIAAKFHNTIADIFFQTALLIKEKKGISTVVLSGGCFQNAYLLERIQKRCKEAGLKTLTHSMVPPNDGGISLGQAVIAGTRAGKYRGKGTKVQEFRSLRIKRAEE